MKDKRNKNKKTNDVFKSVKLIVQSINELTKEVKKLNYTIENKQFFINYYPYYPTNTPTYPNYPQITCFTSTNNNQEGTDTITVNSNIEKNDIPFNSSNQWCCWPKLDKDGNIIGANYGRLE